MLRRCPWCLEPLSSAERRLAACPRCDRALTGPDGEPDELDLRYPGIEARQQARAREVLQWGIPAVAAVAVAASVLHVGGLALAPVTAAVHLVVLRLYVVREGRRYLGPTRRLFTRWAARFAFLWLGLPGYATMTVPVAGIVGAVATFAGLTALVHGYAAWGLARERDHHPLLGWEKALMLAVAVATALVVAGLAIAVLAVGWSAMAIIDWLRPE